LNSNILEWVKESKFALGYIHWFRRYSLMQNFHSVSSVMIFMFWWLYLKLY